MNNLKKLLPVLLLAFCMTFLFTACTETTPCTENEHKAITTAYAKLYNADESEISFTCYAQFNGTHILMFNGMHMQVISIETVDGVVFHHSDSKTFDVYNNGEFYSLQEAFDRGLITHKNLPQLRDIYNSK